MLKVLQKIRGYWQEYKGLVLEHSAGAPPEGISDGGVYYDSTSKAPMYYDGTTAKPMAGTPDHEELLNLQGGETGFHGHNTQVMQDRQEAAGAAGGYAVYDSQGVIPLERLPVGLLGGLNPKGAWNPSTNTPALANPAQATTRGWFYIASGTGTQLGTDWASGDWCVSDGTTWQKIDNTDRVASVFGRLGAVTAQAGDYSASQITVTPTGSVAAVTAQAAIAELDAEKLSTTTAASTYATIASLGAHTGDSSGAHAASAISCTATGDVGATNVQSAIAELASEKLAASTAATTYAPINTTLSDNAASSTPPTTSSGSLVSKIQQIRDYLKYLLAQISAAQSTADTKLARDGSQTMNGDLIFQGVSGTSKRFIQLGSGANDLARITAGATADNAGFLEIATADDGEEPIYLRQYKGVFATLFRTATLLDASGNTQFPGTVTASAFSGNLSGNAATSTALTSSAGDANTPVYFAGGKPVACTSLDLPTTGNAATATALTTSAGDANTPVYFSGGKPVVCTSLDLSTSGNAATASKLAAARTISLTGDVTGSVPFDGSANINISATVTDDSHNHVIGNVDGLDTALAGKASAEANSSGWGTFTNSTGAMQWLDGFTMSCPVAAGGKSYCNQILEIECSQGPNALLQHYTKAYMHMSAQGPSVTFRAETEGDFTYGEIFARHDNAGTVAFLTIEVKLPPYSTVRIRRVMAGGSAGSTYGTSTSVLTSPMSYAFEVPRRNGVNIRGGDPVTLPAYASVGTTVFVDGTDTGWSGVTVNAPGGTAIYRNGYATSASSVNIGAYSGRWFVKTDSMRWRVDM